MLNLTFKTHYVVTNNESISIFNARYNATNALRPAIMHAYDSHVLGNSNSHPTIIEVIKIILF